MNLKRAALIVISVACTMAAAQAVPAENFQGRPNQRSYERNNNFARNDFHFHEGSYGNRSYEGFNSTRSAFEAPHYQRDWNTQVRVPPSVLQQQTQSQLQQSLSNSQALNVWCSQCGCFHKLGAHLVRAPIQSLLSNSSPTYNFILRPQAN